MKLIPKGGSTSQKECETDEEIDYGFSGMVSSSKSRIKCAEWIIDSGASDHMVSSLESMVNVKRAPSTFTITLPTGVTALITHVGNILLANGLKLSNVLHVPQFNHNLLSIHKLSKDSKCDVIFHPNKCTIIDSATKDVIGMGEMKQGLYYLKNEEIYMSGQAINGQKSKEIKVEGENQFALWHHILGHASLSKIQRIEQVKPFLSQQK